ncbi:extracellular solute-binding protein [Microbacterium sp. Se63.02b]|uniref:ABC transporter substrate-binding protein n=1 Tax=Microbacterium sp. Se63.02b TaxID=2709304 RepID=UPI001604C2CD|nr:extracellular solute-binding protein [Microbacterium sp. Se63.02b]QNA92365.1 extracellular solute-binding protein [Microbacterium sp. Se63.02b]
MFSKKTRTAGAVSAGIAAVLALSACAPGGGGAESSGPTDVSKDVAGAGDVTLKLSDFWGSAEEEWITTLIDEFEDEYPNVTIERTREDWGQLTGTLNLQLQDAGGPDIASANNGWSSLGTLAKGGLVLNLDAYADLYGWADAVPTTIARQNQFTKDFTTIGEGSWFATPLARASLIGIYYNADMLDALGIPVPTTLDELESAAAAVKAAGRSRSATAVSTATPRRCWAFRPCTARPTRSTTSYTAMPRLTRRRPASRRRPRRCRSGTPRAG